jgi:hypothetical protein
MNLDDIQATINAGDVEGIRLRAVLWRELEAIRDRMFQRLAGVGETTPEQMSAMCESKGLQLIRDSAGIQVDWLWSSKAQRILGGVQVTCTEYEVTVAMVAPTDEISKRVAGMVEAVRVQRKENLQ